MPTTAAVISDCIAVASANSTIPVRITRRAPNRSSSTPAKGGRWRRRPAAASAPRDHAALDVEAIGDRHQENAEGPDIDGPAAAHEPEARTRRRPTTDSRTQHQPPPFRCYIEPYPSPPRKRGSRGFCTSLALAPRFRGDDDLTPLWCRPEGSPKNRTGLSHIIFRIASAPSAFCHASTRSADSGNGTRRADNPTRT